MCREFSYFRAFSHFAKTRAYIPSSSSEARTAIRICRSHLIVAINGLQVQSVLCLFVYLLLPPLFN